MTTSTIKGKVYIASMNMRAEWAAKLDPNSITVIRLRPVRIVETLKAKADIMAIGILRVDGKQVRYLKV